LNHHAEGRVCCGICSISKTAVTDVVVIPPMTGIIITEASTPLAVQLGLLANAVASRSEASLMKGQPNLPAPIIWLLAQ
jgi:hypothetical protein